LVFEATLEVINYKICEGEQIFEEIDIYP